MTEVHSLVECLQDLKLADRSKSTALAERALNLIFSVGTRKASLTEEEKSALGALLKDAIQPIRANVQGTACRYRTRLESNVLRKRSSIQFLVDDFGGLPDGDGDGSPLSAALQESARILDKIIADFKEEDDSDEGGSDLEAAGASRVPPSHTWWSP